MANHTNLPIYKAAYDLLNTITDLTKNMPRDFKNSLGGKLRDESVEIVVLIFRANCARDKKIISVSQYAEAIGLTQGIGKQANGWRRAAALPAS